MEIFTVPHVCAVETFIRFLISTFPLCIHYRDIFKCKAFLKFQICKVFLSIEFSRWKLQFYPFSLVYITPWKKIFRLTKICEKCRKDLFSLVFTCFRFMEISYFLIFPSNENVRKYLSANAYFCLNMKLRYMIVGRKDETFYVVL